MLRDSRTEILDERSLRLLATADFVAEKLESATDLDWSAAIIGQCKAFEVEMAERFIKPLAARCASADLTEDIADKDLGRVARYCAGRAEKPPELGAVRHFLETAANSRTRQESSVILGVLRDLARDWPRSDWLLGSSGASADIDRLTREYRNRAAHTDELTQRDYLSCAELVTGQEGLLWKLVSSTTGR